MSFATPGVGEGGLAPTDVAYNFVRQEILSGYKYFGFISKDGIYWQFKRKEVATGIWEIADGLIAESTPTLDTFDEHWDDKDNKSYGYF